MRATEIEYQTRDGKGNDFTKMVKIKEFPVKSVGFNCKICGKDVESGVSLKDCTSSNFTDWDKVGEYVCVTCSKLFSLYYYNYIVDDDGVRLINVRQLRDELCRPQKPPYLFCITTTQKKHLFYRAKWNYADDVFAVQLETETIYTTHERMKTLFAFVENLQTLGQGKTQMQNGEIRFDILQKTGFDVLKQLQDELARSREIQIPLYCGQKLEISEEEAICNISSALKALRMQNAH